MKLTLRGVEYQSDLLALYEISLGEARKIKRHTGMTISDWRVGLMTFTREDPDVLASLVYLLRHRARKAGDPEVDWSEIDQIGSKELAEGFEWEDVDTELVARVRAGGETVESGPDSEPPAESDEQRPPRRTTKAAPKKPSGESCEPVASANSVD